MKKVLILRHTDRDLATGKLNEAGIAACVELKKKLPKFDMVVASPTERTFETAKLLADAEPEIDERAGIPPFTPEQIIYLRHHRVGNQLGAPGVIFNTPELRDPARVAGQRLVELIKEVLGRLPINGIALIVSHDGTMVSAAKTLADESFDFIAKNYSKLGGFYVDELLELRPF